MKLEIINWIKKICNPFVLMLFSAKDFPKTRSGNLLMSENVLFKSEIGEPVRLYAPYDIRNSKVGDYSYVAKNSYLQNTQIGKFCSVGPNFCSGLGIHPVNGISTAPMFYSTAKQNGITLCRENKMKESETVMIGHDVFIGANVTILDGVKIGTGAVIGAGAVVTKDIPEYAIAVGVPAKVVKFRFDQSTIDQLIKTEWWNGDIDSLSNIEQSFYDVNNFSKRIYE